MRVDCPFCGGRDVHEFVMRGDADPVRPEGGDEDAFYKYLYLRDNPKGMIREHWYHAQGCRNWLVVERNTVTHEVASVMLAREVR